MTRYDDFAFSFDYLKPANDFHTHIHDYTEMGIILSGSAVNSIDGKEYPVGEGDVYVVEKGATHEITQICGLELFNIGFNANALRKIGQDLLTMPGFYALFMESSKSKSGTRKMHLDNAELKHIRPLLFEMLQEYTDSMPGFHTALISCFYRLIVLLARKYTQTCEPEIGWQIASAAARMESEYSANISIADIAKDVYLSERHFRREFARVYGMSPSAYLLKIRMGAACNMLRAGNKPIGEIATYCGFGDGNYFTRVFHHHFGITPNEYRKRNLNISNINTNVM